MTTTANDWDPSALRLIGGKVLIEVEPAPDRLRPDSVIIIPEMARDKKREERWNVGRVVAMGPGMKVAVRPKWKPGAPYRWPMPGVRVGDRVVYRTWASRVEFARDGRKFEIVSDESLDAVLEDEAAE